MDSSSSSDEQIQQLRKEIDIPQDVYLHPLSEDESSWETTHAALSRGGIVMGESHLRILRFPLHPLIHYICVLCNLHLMQLTPNGLRCIVGFIIFSTINDARLTIHDFFSIFTLTKAGSSGGVERYTFSPRKLMIMFTGMPTSDKDWASKGLLAVTGNWQAVCVDRVIFPMRMTMNRASGTVYSPPGPKLSSERVEFLSRLVAPKKSNALHIHRVVNRDCLQALMRCGPHFSPLSAGDPSFFFMGKDQRLFSQHKTHFDQRFAGKLMPPRGLDLPSPEILAASEMFSPDELDWTNLKRLQGKQKSAEWSQDPYVKKASLKLPYKPENLGFEMLATGQEDSPDDPILVSNTNAMAAEGQGHVIATEASVEGKSTKQKSRPSASVAPEYPTDAMSPPSKARPKRKDLHPSPWIIGIPAPRPGSPTPPDYDAEGQLQHCPRKQRVESEQVYPSGDGFGPSSMADISGPDSSIAPSDPSPVLHTSPSSPPASRPPALASGSPAPASASPPVSPILPLRGATSLSPSGHLLPPSLVQQPPELPFISPSALHSGEFLGLLECVRSFISSSPSAQQGLACLLQDPTLGSGILLHCGLSAICAAQQLQAPESRLQDVQEKFAKASEALDLAKKELNNEVAARKKNLSALAAAESELSLVNERLALLESENQGLHADLSLVLGEKDGLRAELNNEVAARKNDLSALAAAQSKLLLANEMLATLESENQGLRAELSLALSEMDGLRAELNNDLAARKKDLSVLAIAQSELSSANERLATLESENQGLRADLSLALGEKDGLRAELNIEVAARKKDLSLLAVVQSELSSANERLATLESENRGLCADLSLALSEKDGLCAEVSKTEQDLAASQKERDLYFGLHASLGIEVSGLKEQLQSADDHHRDELVLLLTQSHARYNIINKVNTAKCYRLGWEDHARDPADRVYRGGPDEFDLIADVVEHNYNTDFYIHSQGLRIDFLDEEVDSVSVQSPRGGPAPPSKDTLLLQAPPAPSGLPVHAVESPSVVLPEAMPSSSGAA